MEIRKDKLPRQRRRSLQFPELRQLKYGECAVYDLKQSRRVRASVAYLKKVDGLDLLTRTFPDENEIKVWLKEPEESTSTTKEKNHV